MSSGFWEMGGYAFFVWGSYGAAALILIWNVATPRLQRRRLLRRLAERMDDEDDSRDAQ